MHPLTHTWINLRQSQATKDESLRKSQCIIALSRYYQAEWQPYRYHVGLHILSLLDRSRQANQANQANRGLSDFLLRVYVRIGCLLLDLRYDQKAEELMEHICNELRIDRTHVTEGFEVIFEISARIAHQHGDYKRSIGILEQMVNIDATTPYQLYLQHGLACAYLDDRQTRKAIDIYERIITIKKTTCSETDSNLLTTMRNLGRAYLRNNQVEKAINQFGQVLQIQETTLDETHPNRLSSQLQLASAYLSDGQINEAINMLERVVQIRETTLDETNPDRLASQQELARVYLYNKQLAEAIDIYEEIVRIRKETLEETNFDIINSQCWLAEAYLRNGQVKQAIDLFEHAAQIYERTLGETHPSRIGVLEDLAYARSVVAENAAGTPPATPDVPAEQPSSHKPKRCKMRQIIPFRRRGLMGHRRDD
ncbi:hypothetical protein F5B19DRAFT_380584 [Rostrohypoxylon terebratum]|nr:hypothetical protein F5B19DRAFT_380584 [Rostrohypoxylon terebratum]